MTSPINKIRQLYHDVVAELKKCSWPTWHELGESTVVVIVTALLLSGFVLLIDTLTRIIVRWLT